MPQVMKGPFYIDEFEIYADDFGDSLHADVTIGHPDGWRIVVHMEHLMCEKPKATVHVELP